MSWWIALAAAVGIVALLAKSRRNYCKLPELRDPGNGRSFSDTPRPDITVIIPARNEEHNIARAAGSFHNTRVIVVDDNSSDETPEVARNAGAEVIQAPALTGARKGKPNACMAGAAVARTKWIFFADADTWYRPQFIEAITKYAEQHDVGVLSLFPEQVRVGWAERCLLPYAFALYFCGVSARRVNSPVSSAALANGQCLLVKRSAYLQFGGHAAVSESVIEDVALAQKAKAAGLRVLVGRAETLANVRMYDSLAAIWRGFEKNSFRFLLANPWSGAQVIGASILLTSWLPLMVWSLISLPAAALLLLPVPFVALRPWYGSWKAALWGPVAIYLFQLIALSGMFKTLSGRKTIWKGRPV